MFKNKRIYNRNFYNKNGTVLLLALFVLFFTSAIIGIIYSYNSRIFLLAAYERKNYSNYYQSFLEVNSNLYMVKLMNYGFLFSNWKWIVDTHYSSIPHTFSAKKNDGSLRYDPLNLLNAKSICLHDTPDVIYNNIKTNLMNKFNVVGIEFIDKPPSIPPGYSSMSLDLPRGSGSSTLTLIYENPIPNFNVITSFDLKVKIKSKIKDQEIINEVTYPIKMKIKYEIITTNPPFRVKIKMEPI
ncbi:MAG: hypothetical protein ACPL1F_07355 [bacterium]